ncbi:MAG TPA: hypothetical protein VKZ50_14925 [bacterium]|nr:hypothetical protein [bacterium]
MPTALPPGLEPSMVLGVLLWCLILAATAAARADEPKETNTFWKRWHERDEFLRAPVPVPFGENRWDADGDGIESRAAGALD